MSSFDTCPNLSPEISYFDFYSQCVVFHNIKEEEIKRIVDCIINNTYNEKAKILIHEFRHWKDFQSTLWGLKIYNKLFNAYSIRIQPELVSEYWRIVEFINQIKKHSYGTYYSTVFNYIKPCSNDTRWQHRYSIGRRFDCSGRLTEEKLILFSRFETTQGIPICRVPISVYSLLETSAVYESLIYEVKCTINLHNKDIQLNQLNTINKEFKDWVYEPDSFRTRYAVAAHLVSNILGVHNIVEAFRIASIVSDLCLNIPDKILPLLKINAKFYEFKGDIKRFIEEADIGFLFASLLENYQETFLSKNKGFNLNDILKCSDLPSVDELNKLRLTEAKLLSKSLFPGLFIYIIAEYHIIAERLFRELSIGEEGNSVLRYLLSKDILPYVICEDTDFNSVRDVKTILSGLLTEHEKPYINEWYFIVNNYLKHLLYDFYDIAGV